MDWAKNGPEIDDVDFTKPIANGPLTFGFDYFFGISASLDMPPYVYIENDHVTAIPDHVTSDMGKRFWREGPTAPDFRHEEVLPKLTEKALEIIEECNNEPFFLYFPLPAPHTPILPTSEFQGLSNTNEYGDFVLMVDDLIGKITKKVDELKIRENTIIIFTSDNGCSPAANYEELALCGHNPSYVYRGYKADIYEGGHRIPLLVRWPASISPGRVTEEPVCLSDLFATIAEILGYNIPDNTAEDSVSNLPVWIQSDYVKPLREAIVHHSIFGSFSIRKGKWKLELCPGSGGWSYPKPGQEHKDSPPIQLYDLEKDISEKNNVQDLYPDIVNELKDLLIKYIKEGRSTPGRPQKNTGDDYWSQLSWMNSE
jgi:arylsulfatase A-like enzyme